jgi:hypothetical protein
MPPRSRAFPRQDFLACHGLGPRPRSAGLSEDRGEIIRLLDPRQLGDRHIAARDGDLLACLDSCEEIGEIGLRLADLDNRGHEFVA